MPGQACLTPARPYATTPRPVPSLPATYHPAAPILTSSLCAHQSLLQIQSEFPEILPIRESLIKYVFEPNAKKVSG